LESWEVVLVELAAEMLARQAQGLRLDEKSKIAAQALARSKVPKKHELPKVDTVAKKISEILEKMDGPIAD
jgi:hypothetical protein